MRFLRPYPPLLKIEDWRKWKLKEQKRPPVEIDLVHEIFETHYDKMFDDPRSRAERDYPGEAGTLIEVEHEGNWYRIAFGLNEEDWIANLFTVVVTPNPRFHREGLMGLLNYLYRGWKA